MPTVSRLPARALFIGIGNEYRGDDAAGLIAARLIRDAQLDGVAVIENTGDGATLMEAWEGASDVIVIDAAQSGAPPGTIHRFNANERSIPRAAFTSTHAFGLAEAVELSRALGKLPEKMVIYGIESTALTAGAPLSPEVHRAVHDLVTALSNAV